MNLQDYVDISKEISYLRQARDLLRSVQFELQQDDYISQGLQDEIEEFFEGQKGVLVD